MVMSCDKDTSCESLTKTKYSFSLVMRSINVSPWTLGGEHGRGRYVSCLCCSQPSWSPTVASRVTSPDQNPSHSIQVRSVPRCGFAHSSDFVTDDLWIETLLPVFADTTPFAAHAAVTSTIAPPTHTQWVHSDTQAGVLPLPAFPAWHLHMTRVVVLYDSQVCRLHPTWGKPMPKLTAAFRLQQVLHCPN